ncbi:hypothetical protein AFL01nite_05710 [Aeromicrobium flavum]|uniref:Uncharacterized protein n=1 Tax=Aeromicrobium flavum TaxID=416568 RepID=A0A512HS13_9ACTN|nr:hypothetical protein AFL01nite_05710 [Aeromicrobium flavum]
MIEHDHVLTEWAFDESKSLTVLAAGESRLAMMPRECSGNAPHHQEEQSESNGADRRPGRG